MVKVVGEDKKFNAFPVFWDLVMEDVPQLVLPIYEVATKCYWELDAITVVSLTGTALMTLVNSIRVVKGIRKTAKESAASFKKELELAGNGGKGSQYLHKDDIETLIADLGDKIIAQLEAELKDLVSNGTIEIQDAERLLKAMQEFVSSDQVRTNGNKLGTAKGEEEDDVKDEDDADDKLGIAKGEEEDDMKDEDDAKTGSLPGDHTPTIVTERDHVDFSMLELGDQVPNIVEKKRNNEDNKN